MAVRQALLLLLLLQTLRCTHAIKLCDLGEETCLAEDEFLEYSFTSWINDSYDWARKYLGVYTEPGERIDDDDDDVDNMTGAKDMADYMAEWNELEFEGFTDDFLLNARNLALEMSSASLDTDTADMFATMMKEALETEEDIVPEQGDGDFEYPPSVKLEAGEVGQVKVVELSDGRTTTMKTLALKPHLFEIDQFLTDEESDELLGFAMKAGTVKSGVFVDLEAVVNGTITSAVRNSNSTTLEPPRIDKDFLKKIHERISKVTNIPQFVIEGGEPLNIGHYTPGGYYHAHYDSNEASRKKIHCCFQSACKDSSGKEHEASDCCTICRYATFLYYLTDVEEGGETAFPFADMTMAEIVDARDADPDWNHLGKHCYDSRVVVKPAKGKAIFWYNHLLDNSGYLGGVDKRSVHGGCNVTAGSKWIATNWISTPIYAHRYRKPRYRDISESYKQYIQSLS